MGPIVPAPPLPHHHLRFEGYGQVAQDVPTARGEPRPPCQGITRLDWRVQPCPREVFQIHPVVRERGEDVFIGKWGSSAVANTFALEVTTVCNLFDRQHECGHFRADPGYHGETAQSGRFVVVGVSYPGSQEGVGRDWNSSEGEVWWETTTS